MKNRKSLIPFGDSNDTSIDYLIGILEDARVTTLEKVEGISTEELHWQFAEGWNSIGALLGHIIALENCLSIGFLERRELNEAEKEKYLPALKMGKYLPTLITNEPLETYLEKMETSRKKLLKQVKKIGKSDFHKRLDVPDVFNQKTGCNLAWVFYHLAEDEIHHRGQITILRKLYRQFKGL